MKNKKGISLIVLVITIIVLAILAASVIVTITNSGIINKATDTVQNYDLAQVRSLASLAWSEALMDETIITDAEYDAYVKQQLTNAGVNVSDYEISVRTSGVTVDENLNMDWEANVTAATPNVTFTKADGVTPGDPNNLESGDIVLYGCYEYRYKMEVTKEVYTQIVGWNSMAKDGWGVDLRENYLTKSKVGSICNSLFGKNVVSLAYTFEGSSITKSPEIPNTIFNMEYTYKDCAALVEVQDLPSSVDKITGTFQNCRSLKVAPAVVESSYGMYFTFDGCSSLEVAPEIPKDTLELVCTFRGCTSLEQAPVIPHLVENLTSAFEGCIKLKGTVLVESPCVGMNSWVMNEPSFTNAFLNIENELIVKVPAETTTYDDLVAAYGNVNNIIIETYIPE